MEITLISRGPEETESLGEVIGGLLEGKEVLGLCGDLGSGKTTFVRGLVRGLGGKEEEVSSPSFTLMHEYRGGKVLYHFDFYRLGELEDLESIGFRDYLGEGVVVVEWADRIRNALPEEALWITFEFLDDRTRQLKLYAIKGRGLKVVEALRARGYNFR